MFVALHAAAHAHRMVRQIVGDAERDIGSCAAIGVLAYHVRRDQPAKHSAADQQQDDLEVGDRQRGRIDRRPVGARGEAPDDGQCQRQVERARVG